MYYIVIKRSVSFILQNNNNNNIENLRGVYNIFLALINCSRVMIIFFIKTFTLYNIWNTNKHVEYINSRFLTYITII